MIINGISTISGIGAYLPRQIVTSNELMEAIGSERYGVPHIYMQDRLGIKSRRYAQKNEQCSDLAAEAGKAAIIDAGVHTDDIDAVIYCGIERDFSEPASAHIVANNIGIDGLCFDVSNACHGFMDGVHCANNLFAVSSVENVLVVTAEKGSTVIEKALHRIKNNGANDKEFRKWLGVLSVGDAGGAVILSRKTGNEGFIKFNLQSSSHHNHLCYYHNHGNFIEGQMIMDKISAVMLKLHRKAIQVTYELLEWVPEDVSKLVCHQVGITPHNKMAEIAKISYSLATNTIRDYANIASATIPVNFALNRPQKGDKVLIMGAGSGLSISQSGMIFS